MSLEDMLARGPVDREELETDKERLLEEVRAYRLRELREGAALTQVELAERLDVSQNRVSKIEHGAVVRAQVETLRRYAEAVGGELHVEIEIAGRRVEIA
ncbi:helix-turn-helix domain-containing protein [Nocardiopsis xinjiangensis]|uniref:helix-turn-helix domain-containing protein n=1 Tax=Nocardiopsis xinjiangensis TaxID=124285 RepID=UPI001F4C78F8|nr:helix-turn-helix transcriptional regulator [Nocardiopsis xinjiangensis]